MGEKDKSEKRLEDCADVFADIVNVLAFQGKQILKEENLVSGSTESIYKADSGELRSQYRDIMKYDRKGDTLFSVIGIENQSTVDPDMVLRIMKYNAISYQAQIESGTERRPVITLLLYFGTKRWNGPKTLFECLKIEDIPYKEYLPALVNDQKLNLIEVAFLPEEVRNQLKSDFQIAANYFCAVREGTLEEFWKNNKTSKHVPELLEFLRVFANDARYEMYAPAMIERAKKGEKISMCSLLDYAENKGKVEGKIEGKIEAQKEIALGMLKEGVPYRQIVKFIKVPAETLKTWQQELKQQERE